MADPEMNDAPRNPDAGTEPLSNNALLSGEKAAPSVEDKLVAGLPGSLESPIPAKGRPDQVAAVLTADRYWRHMVAAIVTGKTEKSIAELGIDNLAEDEQELTRWLADCFDPREAWSDEFVPRAPVPPARRETESASPSAIARAAGLPEESPVESPVESRITPVDALAGGIQEIALRMLIESERLAGSPQAARAFFGGTLAATLSRLEQEGVGSREERIDLVLAFLAAQDAAGNALFQAGTAARLVAALWGYLMAQPDEEREEGFYQSALGLAQWASGHGGAEGRAQALYYYHALLCAGPKRCGGKVIHIAANNLAGHLADIAQRQHGDGGWAPRVLNRLHTLAIACQPITGQEPPLPGEELWQTLFGAATGLDGGKHTVALSALIEIANVSSAWEVVDTSLLTVPDGTGALAEPHAIAAETGWQALGEPWQAYVNLRAALARMALNSDEDADEIASSLFNIGAGIGLWLKDNTDRMLPAERLRFAVNALGCRWALTQADDVVRALHTLHGIDCAVNLFGAATEVVPCLDTQAGDPARDALGRLAAGLFAAVDRDKNTWMIGNSLKELKITLPASEPAASDLAGLRQALDEALGAVLPGLLPAAINMAPRDLTVLLPLDNWLSQELTAIFGAEQLAAWQENLNRLLANLAHLSMDPASVWQRLYRPWLGAAGKNGTDNPALSSGQVTPDAWASLVARATLPGIRHLGDWINRNVAAG